MDVKRYGPWALIVGGSEGIGSACARKLAADGFNIVLVARKPGPLAEVAGDVSALGAQVRTASVDLSRADALQQVRAVTDDIEIGLLIYNAGAESHSGDFLDIDPDRYRATIAINVTGQVEFTRHYGSLMKQRGHGGIALAGSTSNFLGSASLAAYTGSKAFSRIFTEALWAECQTAGIDVLHYVVSFTDTPAMQRSGFDTSYAQSPEEVAELTLANIANGPLLILGGKSGLDLAIQRSQITDRAALIRTISTPRKEDIPKAKA